MADLLVASLVRAIQEQAHACLRAAAGLADGQVGVTIVVDVGRFEHIHCFVVHDGQLLDGAPPTRAETVYRFCPDTVTTAVRPGLIWYV